MLASTLQLSLTGPANACVSEQDIVNIDLETVTSIDPCNNMVEVYARSLGLKLPGISRKNVKDIEQYPFFFPARQILYLSLPHSRSRSIEDAGNLAAILALAPSIPFERRGAYQLFSNNGFLRLDAPEIGNLDIFFCIRAWFGWDQAATRYA